jgi:hypothetical protein
VHFVDGKGLISQDKTVQLAEFAAKNAAKLCINPNVQLANACSQHLLFDGPWLVTDVTRAWSDLVSSMRDSPRFERIWQGLDASLFACCSSSNSGEDRTVSSCA